EKRWKEEERLKGWRNPGHYPGLKNIATIDSICILCLEKKVWPCCSSLTLRNDPCNTEEIYMHTHTHTHTYTHMHTHTQHTHTHIYTYIHAHRCTNTHTHTHTHCDDVIATTDDYVPSTPRHA